MLVVAGDMVGTRLDRGQVDVVAGLSTVLLAGQVTVDLSAAQVLISIQSMILCDEPYLNEPGWANSGGTPKSLACEYWLESEAQRSLTYSADSANVRRMVVKTAVSLPRYVLRSWS